MYTLINKIYSTIDYAYMYHIHDVIAWKNPKIHIYKCKAYPALLVKVSTVCEAHSFILKLAH